MKAKLTAQRQNGKNYGGDKETTERKVLVALKAGKLHQVVDARFYMGRSASASVVYCSVWINADNFHTAGHGQAGGYGYHKASAAFAEALRSAGVELYGSPYSNAREQTQDDKNHKGQTYIGGCGDRSIDEAMKAIAHALGFRGQLMIV